VPIDALTEHVTRVGPASPPREIPRVGVQHPVLSDAFAEIELPLDVVVVRQIARGRNLDREEKVADLIGIRRSLRLHQPHHEDVRLHTIAAAISAPHV
jgi:hypothetical protein